MNAIVNGESRIIYLSEKQLNSILELSRQPKKTFFGNRYSYRHSMNNTCITSAEEAVKHMKITSNRLDAILRRQDELKNLAQQFADEKRPSMRDGPIRFDDSGNIEMAVNTACHCHPEYKWVYVGTKEEFCEWLDKMNY